MGVIVTYGDYTFPNPTPSVTWSYEYDQTSAGRNIGSTLRIGIQGQIYNPGTADSAFSPILGPQTSALQKAFEKDFQSFTIISSCGSTVFPFSTDMQTDVEKGIYVDSITIDNSDDEYWRNFVSYSIQLTVPLNSGQKYGPDLNNIYISSLSDNMSVSEEDGADYLQNTNEYLYPSGGPLSTRFLSISRTISAQGKDRLDKRAITSAIEAVKKVNEHLSFEDRINTTFAGLKFFDKSTTQNYNDIEGSYSVTDTYKAFSGTPSEYYTHEYNISNTIDNKLKRTVSINGTIQGYNLESSASTDIIFANGDSTTTKEPAGLSSNAYTVASGGFLREVDLIKDRVLNATFSPVGSYVTQLTNQATYGGFKIDQEGVNNNPLIHRTGWLHPVPVSYDSSHDINGGTVTYTCNFDNRPMNLIAGATSESLSIQDNHAVTGFTSTNVMYKGAIMQTLGSITVPSRSVSYNATFDTLVPELGANEQDAFSSNTVLSIGSYDTTQLNNIFDQFDPKRVLPGHSNSWVSEDNVSANFIEGTFTKTRTWNYAIN